MIARESEDGRETGVTPRALRDTAPVLRKRARIVVAFSGGLDSTVLLHLLQQAFPRRVIAVHVHHGLQAAADRWARRCRDLCRRWGVTFELRRVNVDSGDPGGPEAAARAARYQALRECLRPGDVLVTAHHRDDQAETVLLRLLRGSGLRGLAAMRGHGVFAPGLLWRPLLDQPRAELEAYARRRRLRWIEDPHNTDPRYARSFLRTRVMPLLVQRFPSAPDALARTAEHAADAAELLDTLADGDLQPLRCGDALSVAGLLKLPSARRDNVLRRWLQCAGHALPAQAVMGRLETEVLRARVDAEPSLAHGPYEFRRYRDTLHVMPRLLAAPDRDFRVHWEGRRALDLPRGCGRLRLQGRRPAGFAVEVRFARGGERLRLRHGAPTRTLKNLFQEAAVPPWQRQRTPLLWRDDALVAAGDRWLAPELSEPLQAAGCRLIWEPDAGGAGLIEKQ